MSIDKDAVLMKLLSMFRPYSGREFLDHDGKDVICGPNDRSMFGLDTNFPKEWLVHDHGFTQEEADWFVREVQRLHALATNPTSSSPAIPASRPEPSP